MYNFKENEETHSKKIYLVDQSTWLPWINVIKAKALRGCKDNVWQYIDPSQTVQPKLPEVPCEPQPQDVQPSARSILDLDAVEFAKL